MTFQPAPPRQLERQALLFTPGARLGWTFRDRRQLIARYPEPGPDPEAIREQAAARAAAAEKAHQRARKWAARPSLMLAVLLMVLAGCAKAINPAADTAATMVTAIVLCSPGLAWTAWCWRRRSQAAAADPDEQYRQARQVWEERAAVYEEAELGRLDAVPEWGSAVPPARRTDVFGGTLAGWQSLIAVHGASILSEQPLLVADLSGQYASGQLTGLARQAGVRTAAWLLPGDLDRCGLLTGLSPAQLADALAEAIHAGTPAGARADRAIDVRVLEQLAGALGGVVTPARLWAAAQVALGNSLPPGLLTDDEAGRIHGELFPEGYKTQIGANLVRLDAFLSELARYAGPGSPATPFPAYYTCLAVESGARSARAEMLTALTIQWLTVQVAGSNASAPAVVIAGADEISRPHLERLADACERRGVPLTLLFRHLRDDAVGMIGGGATAFMRLGNHAEAEQAASFLGRHHRFVLSQFTATNGGNQTSTRSDTYTYGSTESRGLASTRGWAEDHLGARTASGGRTGSRDFSRSQSWSTSLSRADGTNWSDAASVQRVYEYAVEPAVLQNPSNATPRSLPCRASAPPRSHPHHRRPGPGPTWPNKHARRRSLPGTTSRNGRNRRTRTPRLTGRPRGTPRSHSGAGTIHRISGPEPAATGSSWACDLTRGREWSAAVSNTDCGRS
jgi:hypothetical protein